MTNDFSRVRRRTVLRRVGAGASVVSIAGCVDSDEDNPDDGDDETPDDEETPDEDETPDAEEGILAGDFSTHVDRIIDEQPDVVFTSLWGGDVSALLAQAYQREMFQNVGAVIGTIIYGSADALDEEVLTGTAQDKLLSVSRNYDWRHPSVYGTDVGEQLAADAMDMADITVPTPHFMSGYGAVMGWVSAVETVLEEQGRPVTQDRIAETLEGHSFETPAGTHTFGSDHQCRSRTFAGDVVWDEDLNAPVLTNSTAYAPGEVSPPPGEAALSWLETL